jgi:hypothetical protein
MDLIDRIKTLLTVFRVANDEVIGNVARHIYNLKWKEGLSARNQAHKILDKLALTNQIQKGKGFFAVRDYKGDYREHDRLLTKLSAQLLLLKLPITIHREVSFFPIAIRSDLVILLGRNGKATCAVIEVANNETPEYLNQKIVAWKNWKEAPQALSKLFNAPIPYFSLVVEGISHPLAVDFKKFLEELK